VIRRIPTLYVLVGLPGAGKTTWLEQRRGLRSVSKDRIRQRRTGVYHFDEQIEHIIQGQFWAEIAGMMRRRVSVAADCTNLTRETRRKLVQEALANGMRAVAVYFDTPYRTCLRRGVHRVPLREMAEMRMSLQPPERNEAFAAVYTITPEEK